MLPRQYVPQARAILQVILDGFGPTTADTDPIVVPVIPKSVTVHCNSYKQADSWELGFDAGDLPFDPRLIRAGAVEIYLFQTDALDDKTRVVSRKDPLSDPDPGDQRPRSAVDTLGLDVGLVTSKDRFTYGNKPRIAGLFDDADLELSTDGRWVSISGQDYTAHLASIQWKPEPSGRARRIPVGKRVDLLIADLLAEADTTGKLSVDVRGLDPLTLPIVGATEVRGSKRGIPVAQDTTYWDVIYKVATRYSLIAYVDGLDVVLSRPKTISDKNVTEIKRLAWGRNLTSMKLSRQLGKEQAPTIVVKGYDPVARSAVTVEYPDGQLDNGRLSAAQFHRQSRGKGVSKNASITERHKAKKGGGKGKTTTTLRQRDEYQVVPIYGVTDRETLRKIAENYYHLLGKAERKCIVTTRDLSDLGDPDRGRAPSDMLSLSAGDAVTIDWDDFNRELMSNPQITDEEKVSHLMARGFNRTAAQLVAEHYAKLAGLDRPLRVREVTYEYSADDGIGIEIELLDFIVIDGIRTDSGAATAPRTARARESMVDNDGNPIGWDREYQDAQGRRYG